VSGGGKKLRRWLRALLILFALIAGIAMLLGFLVFSSPETFAIRQVAVDDTVVQAALASNIYMQVQNAAPGKTAEVVLPPDQVDALIQIAVNGAVVRLRKAAQPVVDWHVGPSGFWRRRPARARRPCRSFWHHTCPGLKAKEFPSPGNFS